MIDITRLSSHYITRILDESDVDKILEVCQQNTLFYEYTEARPTSEQIQDDMKLTPPGIDLSAKYFFGFFADQDLVAVNRWVSKTGNCLYRFLYGESGVSGKTDRNNNY